MKHYNKEDFIIIIVLADLYYDILYYQNLLNFKVYWNVRNVMVLILVGTIVLISFCCGLQKN